MTPDDPRHGTNAGYIAGCRVACCKAAQADYRRSLRTRQYLTKGQLTVDATGTKRRIRALSALGWPTHWVDDELGKARTYTTNVLTHRYVLRSTAQSIAAVYDRLSMTPPPTGELWQRQVVARTKNLARRKGWAPPLAWDNIDDPNETPSLDAPAAVNWQDSVDDAVVARVLAGERRPRQLTRAEGAEIVSVLLRRGHSTTEIETRYGLKPERYHRVNQPAEEVA